MKLKTPKQMTFQGRGTSRGLAVGKVQLLDDIERSIVRKRIEETGIPGEIARLQDALLATRKQLIEIRKHVGDSIDENAASIFDVHLMMIDDPSFIEKIVAGLRTRKLNLEHILRDVMRVYAKRFTDMQDAYIQDRGADIKDLMNRILQNLEEEGTTSLIKQTEGVILVANDLLPSVTALLDKRMILGIATEMGGQTSHAAIIARALEIPAVVGLEGLCAHVQSGDEILIDGTQGRVLLNPSQDQRAQFGQLEHLRADLVDGFKQKKNEAVRTRDGVAIQVVANLELPEHLDRVLESGADGIGLFRTEFLFLSRPDLPSEDEQAAAYEAVAQAMHPAKVVIRSLDVGGDKCMSHQHIKEQSESPLGCRGIRLSLARPDVFKVQLRAILRAARFGNVKLMYPMVSGVDEIRQADILLGTAKEELEAEGIAYGTHLETGVMIETPSAALTAERMAAQTDFFSVGTNDLVQYTIAVDRLEQEVATLYDPLHPAVLSLLRDTVRAAKLSKIPVSVCGEMAGSPLMLPVLIGLGITDLSVAPGSIPLIKHLTSNLDYKQAEKLAKQALLATDTTSILQASQEMLEASVPELKDLLFF